MHDSMQYDPIQGQGLLCHLQWEHGFLNYMSQYLNLIMLDF